MDHPFPQAHLGKKSFIVLIALLSAFVPLSTDLYLPALPGMAGYFHVSTYMTNLTLILFFVFFSLGMLVWGPMSDRHGRRPVLLAGLAVYVVGSVACALSGDILVLILARVLQALGGSAGPATAPAILKDVYSGRRLESTLTIVQSLVVISPAVAPVIGAFMLPFTSWRGIFWVLAGVGVVAMGGVLLLGETCTSRRPGTALQSLRRLGSVLKNPGFTAYLLVFSLVSTASLAFVADSSYIYIEEFGLSERVYSFYFAFYALALIAGPFLYLRLSRSFRRRSIIPACFAVMIAGGVLVCLFGPLHPMCFALAIFPAALMGSCVRSPGIFLTLEQQDEDIGSASSLINCSFLLFGSAGMVIASLAGDHLVYGLGLINLAVGAVCLAGWVLIGRFRLAREVADIAGSTG